MSRVRFEGVEGNALVADRTGPWPARDHALFLHGGGQTRHAWGGTARRLAAAGWTATALDQRGHGDSAWVESGAYAFEDYAADLGMIARREAAQTGVPPVIVGASLGGLAAMLAIGEGLAPARALVLVDVTPRMDSSGVEKIQGFMAERSAEGFATLEEAADAVAAYLPHRPRPRSLDGLRKNLRLGADGRWRWHWDPRFITGPRSVNHMRAIIETRMVAAVGRIDAPILLVRGASSELVREDHAAEFLRLRPTASYVDVRGARHMVAGDENDAFAGAVIDFVKGLAPAS